MLLKKNYIFFLFGFWILLLAVGFGALSWYKLRPGPVGEPAVFWPQNISYDFDQSTYNLVLFAHPKCGCTYASLVELEKILSETKGKMKVKIFFFRPKKESHSWIEGESLSLATKLPQTEIIEDPDAEMAKRFGAMTSGQVMMYGKDGHLTYAGGITESRGHVGDNMGSRSIASVIETGTPKIQRAPVFGCQLFSITTGKK